MMTDANPDATAVMATLELAGTSSEKVPLLSVVEQFSVPMMQTSALPTPEPVSPTIVPTSLTVGPRGPPASPTWVGSEPVPELLPRYDEPLPV